MSSASTALSSTTCTTEWEWADADLVLVSFCDVVALSSTAYTGEWEWEDSDNDTLPDAGEKVDYTFVVTNEGTVTLQNVKAVSSRGSVACTGGDDDLAQDIAQPVAELRVGSWYACTTSLEVRVLHRGTERPHAGGQGRLWIPADPVSCVR